MVEVGVLSVKGTLDTTDITRGQNRIKQGFKGVKEEGNNANKSLNRISGVTTSLVAGFGKLATVGISAITGIAALSPQVAPELAKLKVEFFKLSNVLGGELKPAFGFVADNFEKFVNLVSNNSGLIGTFVDTGLSLLEGTLKDISTGFDSASESFDKFNKKVEQQTGGTSFTEELGGQFGDFTSNIREKGLTRGLAFEAGQTIDSLAELAVNTGADVPNNLFGTSFGSTNVSLFENFSKYAPSALDLFNPIGLYQNIKEEFFNDTDTVGY